MGGRLRKKPSPGRELLGHKKHIRRFERTRVEEAVLERRLKKRNKGDGERVLEREEKIEGVPTTQKGRRM